MGSPLFNQWNQNSGAVGLGLGLALGLRVVWSFYFLQPTPCVGSFMSVFLRHKSAPPPPLTRSILLKCRPWVSGSQVDPEAPHV